MGRASVAGFALLSGYVNSLKPIKQSRAGAIDAALSGVAKSAFRRTGRFMIPAIISTTLSWLACQFGAYRLAKGVSSNWIRDTSPVPSGSFASAIYDLFYNLGRTWLDGSNDYDKIQWTLTFLLKGSMMTYLTLFATMYVKPRWRMFILCGLYYFKWKSGDGECSKREGSSFTRANKNEAVVGYNVFMGMILAEITLDPGIQAVAAEHNLIRTFTSGAAIILGLYFASYPENNPEWSRWSNGLTLLGNYIFPKGVEYSRYYSALGVNILATGILFNNTSKKILSNTLFLFMGKLSFAIYLLHAPLIRTVLTYGLFGFSVRPDGGKDEHGNDLGPGLLPVANRWVCVFVIPLFYIFLYRVAALWAAYVEPFCGRVTNWFENLVFQEDAKVSQEKPLLPS